MAWLSNVWKRRIPITIDNSTASTPADAQGIIPKDLPFFWDRIDASGNELRVTAADGVTLLTYDIVASGGGAFSKTNKDGRIDIDGMTLPASPNSMVLAWLYYDSTSNQGDGSSAVVIAAPKALYIVTGKPKRRRFAFMQHQAYATRPPFTLPKFTSEIRDHFIAYRDALRTRDGVKRQNEEPYYVTIDVVNESSVSQASMFAISETRFMGSEVDPTEIWVVAKVKAGTTNTVRTLLVRTSTVLPYAPSTVHQTLEMAIGFKVKDVVVTA